MVWKIEFSEEAKKQLKKLDYTSKKVVQSYIDNKVLPLSHPKLLGKALSGMLKGYWRYRAGKFRIICEIQDSVLVVKIIRVGHRREVYE